MGGDAAVSEGARAGAVRIQRALLAPARAPGARLCAARERTVAGLVRRVAAEWTLAAWLAVLGQAGWRLARI